MDRFLTGFWRPQRRVLHLRVIKSDEWANGVISVPVERIGD